MLPPYPIAMDPTVAIIGFGEAGAAFAGIAGACGYDRKLADPTLCTAKERDFAAAGVLARASAAEALDGAEAVLSVVTADQALAAATAAAPHLAPGALWLDMNSVAPDTKRAAAAAIEAVGGRYVDVAVMAPVLPKRRNVPLLVAGPHREAAVAMLAAIGFTDVATVDGPVGSASAIKMVRSVMIKGLEALSAECAIAARAAGVLDEVVASLDATWPGAGQEEGGWRRRFDYNLDRMMVHGTRRAAEMEEAAATLQAVGVDPAMTRGTIERQRALGRFHIAPPAGLNAKLAVLAPFTTNPHKADAA